MIVGVLVYGIILILLKDEYLFMFLNKVRNKLLNNKTAEE